jgi:hypothetical protein
MELDELNAAGTGGESVCLELYKKPTDFTRGRVQLFTAKPLYLHLKAHFLRH